MSSIFGTKYGELVAPSQPKSKRRLNSSIKQKQKDLKDSKTIFAMKAWEMLWQQTIVRNEVQ